MEINAITHILKSIIFAICYFGGCLWISLALHSFLGWELSKAIQTSLIFILVVPAVYFGFKRAINKNK